MGQITLQGYSKEYWQDSFQAQGENKEENGNHLNSPLPVTFPVIKPCQIFQNHSLSCFESKAPQSNASPNSSQFTYLATYMPSSNIISTKPIQLGNFKCQNTVLEVDPVFIGSQCRAQSTKVMCSQQSVWLSRRALQFVPVGALQSVQEFVIGMYRGECSRTVGHECMDHCDQF